MLANPKQIEPPTDDKRWRFVQATMRRNGFRRSALIETLHTVQESFGFLDEEALQYVAASLHVPLSQVYGVSTFYHLFSLKGGPRLLEKIEQTYGIKPGETTEDEQVSLMTARCVGACGLAPVAVFDGEVLGNQDPEKTLATLRRWSDDA